jgi:hypothetical protein
MYIENSLASQEVISIIQSKGYEVSDVGVPILPMYGWNRQKDYDASYDPICGFYDSKKVAWNALYLVDKYILQNLGEAYPTPSKQIFPGVTLSKVTNNPLDTEMVFFRYCRLKDVKFTTRTSSPQEVLQAVSNIPKCN